MPPFLVGGLRNGVHDLDFSGRPVRVLARHRMAADEEGGGCVTVLGLWTDLGDPACALTLGFARATGQEGRLGLVWARLTAGPSCPGFGYGDLGVYELESGDVTVAGPMVVPEGAAARSRLSCVRYEIGGHARLRAGDRVLDVELDGWSLEGSLVSHGDADVPCPPDATWDEEGDGAHEPICQPGSFRCRDIAVQRVCTADGTAWEDVICPAGQICHQRRQCNEPVCTPGTAECVDRLTLRRCDPHGTGWEEESCPPRSLCVGPADSEALQTVACRRIRCNPGEQRCAPDGSGEVELCEGGGTLWRAVSCGANRVCVDAECRAVVCAPGTSRCQDGVLDTVLVCNETGTEQTTERCDEGSVCDSGACRECLCEPGSIVCLGMAARRICREDCLGWRTEACEEMSVCGPIGECIWQVCEPGSEGCPDDRTARICYDDGTLWHDLQCAEGQVCHRARCRPRACSEGDVRCLNLVVEEHCNAQETGWIPQVCLAGQRCEQGGCSPQVCVPGEARCDNVSTRSVCSPGGTHWAPAACAQGSLCEEGECRPVVCVPGQQRCLDPVTVGRCNDNGTAFEHHDACDDQAVLESCRAGRCESACELLAALNTTDGCEFVVPDLVPFLPDGGSLQVAVANGSPVPARVRVEVQGEVGALSEPEVPALSGQVIELAGGTIEGSGLRSGAYRLSSNVPISAYLLHGPDDQGAPADMAASRLPPAPVGTGVGDRLPAGWGQEYLVATWPPHGDAHGTLTVVGPGSDIQVTVIPSVAVEAGGGVAATEARARLEADLTPGQVLTLRTAAAGADLTGTEVYAEGGEVMVWAGTAASRAPAGAEAVCCDDPVAHHVPPLSTWGTVHVALRTGPRWAAGDGFDVWRVVAGADGGDLATEPHLDGLGALQLGAALDFTAAEPFVATTSVPALLLRVSTGRDEHGNGEGDPSVTVIAPVRQTACQTAFQVPAHDGVTHWLDVARAGGSVSVDGVPLARDRWESIGESGLEWARLEVDSGFHLVDASSGANATLHAFSADSAWGVPLAFEANEVNDAELRGPGEGEGEGEGGPQACEDHCDCPEQGWVCMATECVSAEDAGWTAWCCSKLPCPPGDFCWDEDGNGDSCP